jgi:hypothetical protein
MLGRLVCEQAAGFTKKSFHQFDLTQPPGLVGPRFERAVEAEEHVPAFARDGLNPVVRLAGRRLADVDVTSATVSAARRRFGLCVWCSWL